MLEIKNLSDNTMQNEYGLAAWKAILGIEILNEGGGLSVDDITNEEQSTYVARATTAWVPISNVDKASTMFGENSQPTPGEGAIYPIDRGAGFTTEAYARWVGVSQDTQPTP